ncbi:hypothetical protein FQZ97_1206830 [compost metagenome]
MPVAGNAKRLDALGGKLAGFFQNSFRQIGGKFGKTVVFNRLLKACDLHQRMRNFRNRRAIHLSS